MALKAIDAVEAVLADRIVPNGPSVFSLRRDGDEPFQTMCARVAAEKQINLSAAIALVSEAFPDLAREYSNGVGL